MSSETKKNDYNNLYIGIFTAVIVAVIIVVLIIKSSSGDNKTGTDAPQVTAAPVSVVATEGAPNQTIKTAIKNLRNIKFGKSHAEIQKYENKKDDTLNGNYSPAPDGTAAYLTYKFNPENIPEFFGTKVVPNDSNSLLEYVFDKNDKMYEIRLQYGHLSKEEYQTIISNIANAYGEATFSRTYSHGSVEHWWKTQRVTLTAYYQDTGVSLYLRKN